MTKSHQDKPTQPINKKRAFTKFNIAVPPDYYLISIGKKIEAGEYVSIQEIVRAFRYYGKQDIPESVFEYLQKAEIPRPRGRIPLQGFYKHQKRMILVGLYYRYLGWLQKRKRTYGHLKGWFPISDAGWWQGPPHERAALMVIQKLGLNMSKESLRNFISSQK